MVLSHLEVDKGFAVLDLQPRIVVPLVAHA